MITNKEAKQLGRKDTIDLKYDVCLEYVNKVDSMGVRNKLLIYLDFIVYWIGMFTIAFIVSFGIFFMFFVSAQANFQEDERKERIEACQSVYDNNEEFINSTYIHTSQDVVVRCATMITIIGAYESDYFRSNRCIRDNNCFGIKSWYTGKFKKYNTRYENYLDFAEKYLVGNSNNTFKGHKNRNIRQFVQNWSGDSVEVEERYIKFVESKYWEVYNNIYLLKKGNYTN